MRCYVHINVLYSQQLGFPQINFHVNISKGMKIWQPKSFGKSTAIAFKIGKFKFFKGETLNIFAKKLLK